MSYAKQTWSDTAASGTPITAARMNHIEEGIKKTSDDWDSVSQYTLAEVNTGKKWIDGKPIYRKVIALSSVIKGVSKSFALGVTCSVIIHGSVAENSGTMLPAFVANGISNTEAWSKSAIFSRDVVEISCGTNASFTGGWAVFEYVK